ncbi:hypothetical protein LPICM02_160019 [Pseudolactococcus piscium]|nr:hypothetical protein LPICM02_160019 [Lactococcus piscium]
MIDVRFGELLGLTWYNINYDKKYINVCHYYRTCSCCAWYGVCK